MAMDGEDEDEQLRALATEGTAAAAIHVCGRLLRSESSAQRSRAAFLVLERLQTGGDSADEANTLLRLLGNHVTPSRAFTEQALSLLLFCEHRALVIHHLPKLTYQSKECVKMVIDTYVELLASDRALLVPILGSLADMPLDYADKNVVIDATQSLLDAAEESDIPAVVQSLLSITTPTAAPRVAERLREECRRLQPGMLHLTIEVIGRFATAGSATLRAFLQLIRRTDELVAFDILLLTFLIGRSAENEATVRAIQGAAEIGIVHNGAMREAAQMLLGPEWNSLLPSYVRFCSAILAACFASRVKVAMAVNLIDVSIECLVSLIDTKSVVREETLTLLLTIVSRPKKLLLFSTTRASRTSRAFLAWKIAEVIAIQLADLALRNPSSLSSYAHLFLDHLHGISASLSEYGSDESESYPTHILDSLCSTMALLTKQEHGIYSLLMITIQKQLVSRGGSVGATSNVGGFAVISRGSAVDLRQLMAVFLTGYLLKHNVVKESRDRSSLASWLLRLLSSTARNETLVHVIRFVRDEILRVPSGTDEHSVTDASTRSMFSSAISQVFRKKGFALLTGEQAHRKVAEGFYISTAGLRSTEDSKMNASNTLTIDVELYVTTIRLVSSIGKYGQDANDPALKVAIQREFSTKILLLRELFRCQLMLSSTAEHEEMLMCGFLFPPEYDAAVNSDEDNPIEPAERNIVIWSMACALDIYLESINLLAQRLSHQENPETREEALESIQTRLQSCFTLHDQLERVLAVQRFKVLTAIDRLSEDDQSKRLELESLLAIATIAQQLKDDTIRPIQGENPSASLYGLDLRVISLILQGQWKKTGAALSLTHELLLLQALSKHLQPDNALLTPINANTEGHGSTNSVSTVNKVTHLLSQPEGRRTVKFLAARSNELASAVANSIFTHQHRRRHSSSAAEDFDGEHKSDESDDPEQETTTTWIIRDLYTRSLRVVYSTVRTMLEECESRDLIQRQVRERITNLLAAGTSSLRLRAQHDVSALHCEILFRSFARQSLNVTDASLSCEVIDLLISLVQGTQKESSISQLCLALLCQPLWTRAQRKASNDSSTKAAIGGLPIGLLPDTVALPRGGAQCSLAKYRCSSSKWAHCAYLVVGCWAFTPSPSIGSMLLAQLNGEIQSLVDSLVENHRTRKRGSGETGEDASGGAIDGEHQVLKTLHVNSLPFFMEAVILCVAASFFRATPRASNGSSSSSNPFEEICWAIEVATSSLKTYIAAERAGITMPIRTNQLVIRGATFIMRSIRGILTRCAAWRVEQHLDDDAGDVAYLWSMFDGASLMLKAMEKLLASFQERVMVKMQTETAAIGRLPADDEDDAEWDSRAGNKRKRAAPGNWGGGLLRKVLGKKYRQRRLISKSESALLPFFSHTIQELREFLDEQRSLHNFDPSLRDSKQQSLVATSIVLDPDELTAFCEEESIDTLLSSGVLGLWAPAVRASPDDEVDDDQETKVDGEQEAEEADEGSDTEEEEEVDEGSDDAES